MRFIFQSTKRKLALNDTFPSSLQSLEKYQIRDFVQMPTWTLTAAINNRDIWRKCLHAQKEDSSWKPRKSPGSLNRGFFFFFKCCLFQCSKHLSCTSACLVYLWAGQTQLRKLEDPYKPGGPGQPRVPESPKPITELSLCLYRPTEGDQREG